MATFSKLKLSGSTDGKMIAVAATATPGTLIHTAQSGTANFDEVWCYAVDTSAFAVKLTVEYGGVATSDQVEVTIPAEGGLVLVIPGAVLQNSLVVRAFAATASVLNIVGWVNRIS